MQEHIEFSWLLTKTKVAFKAIVLTFNLVFKDIRTASTLFKRQLKDADGNAINKGSIKTIMQFLNITLLEIEAVYTGDSVPADLKIYKF